MMLTQSIELIVTEYAANKAEADRLTARNADLAEAMLTQAAFKPGSDTGNLTAAGFKVSLTRRLNEKWDQGKVCALRDTLGPTFAEIFRAKYEPDRRALKVFYGGSASDSVKRLLHEACTATPGRPAVKLERVEGDSENTQGPAGAGK